MEVRFYHLFAVAANGRGGFHVTLLTNAQGGGDQSRIGGAVLGFPGRTDDWGSSHTSAYCGLEPRVG